MPAMGTTLTLDDDIAARLKEEAFPGLVWRNPLV